MPSSVKHDGTMKTFWDFSISSTDKANTKPTKLTQSRQSDKTGITTKRISNSTKQIQTRQVNHKLEQRNRKVSPPIRPRKSTKLRHRIDKLFLPTENLRECRAKERWPHLTNHKVGAAEKKKNQKKTDQDSQRILTTRHTHIHTKTWKNYKERGNLSPPPPPFYGISRTHGFFINSGATAAAQSWCVCDWVCVCVCLHDCVCVRLCVRCGVCVSATKLDACVYDRRDLGVCVCVCVCAHSARRHSLARRNRKCSVASSDGRCTLLPGQKSAISDKSHKTQFSIILSCFFF